MNGTSGLNRLLIGIDLTSFCYKKRESKVQNLVSNNQKYQPAAKVVLPSYSNTDLWAAEQWALHI